MRFAAIGPETGGERIPNSEIARIRSPATALLIGEDEWLADPVLISQAFERAGGRYPMQGSTGSTGSFETAFGHTPRTASGPNHNIAELEISHRKGGRVSSCVPQLTDEDARHAVTFASTDDSACVCWLCRTYGHAMYACPFLSPEQRMFTAYRNYRYQMETRPGMHNLIQQSTHEDRGRRQGDTSRLGGGVRFVPRESGYRCPGVDQRDRPEPRRVDTRYPRRDGRGDRSRL